MYTLQEIKDFFKADRFAVSNNIEIEEAYHGYAICSVELKREHLNAMNAVQGGLIFTLADFAFAVAANCQSRDTVTLNSSINFIKPCTGKKLYAYAKVFSEGRGTAVYHINVKDENAVEIAFVTATGYKITHPKTQVSVD